MKKKDPEEVSTPILIYTWLDGVYQAIQRYTLYIDRQTDRYIDRQIEGSGGLYSYSH